MALKKTVGADRRMDLGSFFCMIGRHGPAVALAVVAVVTVLAGFYIYRTVKGRRRKAACDDSAVSTGEEDRDASVTQRSRSEESTEENKGMEDVGNLRRRPAAAVEKKPPTSPQRQNPENKPPTIFRAAWEGEEAAEGVWVKERCLENQQEHEKLLEDKPDDGGVSRITGREEEICCSINTSQICGGCQSALAKISNHAEQLAEGEVLSAHAGGCKGLQPEKEKQGNAPVCDEDKEELSRGCPVSSDEQGKRSNMRAESPDAGSSPKTSQRVDENSESFVCGKVGGRASLCRPRELRSAPDGASPPVCDLQWSSEQTQKKDDDDYHDAAGIGVESGISSLAVSPDLDADGNRCPAQGGHLQTEAAGGLSGSSEVSQQLTDVALGSFQMFHRESMGWTHQQSPAANEDVFGHELEDRYHSYYDRFAALITVGEQLVAGVDVRTSTASVQVVTMKTSISVKEEEQDEDEGSEAEADDERTEISIMEATMDTNEWITDGNAPLPPWAASSPNQPGCPAAEVPSPPQVPQTGTLFADESSEHSKKVVAVQPMPQKVSVTFRVQYRTQWPHQTVAVTGNHPELGGWKGFIPLEKVEEDHWSGVVSLPSDSQVEWKFVLLEQGQVCRWEECRNRLLDTGLADDLLVHTWWGLA